MFLFINFKIQAQTWSLVWSDEFNSANIYSANWNFEIGNGTGGWGNNNLEYDTNLPGNVCTQNGELLIIAKKEVYNGKNYTSARMNTKGLHNLTYGRVEARIKLPMQKGLWPAFWMLGENLDQVGWPQCGEIDIMEHVNTDTVINGTIHWDNNGHAQYGTKTDFDTLGFHVYAIEWDQNSIKWLLDGNVYWNANIANNINSTNEFHNPFFVILNLAVGGTWPGSPDGTSVFPDTMSVDYVRFYQLTSTITHVPLITASGSITICQGDSVILTSDEAASYVWSTNETTRSIVVKSSGSYSVTITDSLGNTSLSTSIMVTVNASPPIPTITEGGGGGAQGSPPSLFTSSSAINNQWYVDDSVIVGANQQDYSPGGMGNYAVLVTHANGCKAISEKLWWLPKPTTPTPSIPVITSSGSLTICQGDSVILTCSTANSYLWSTVETTQSIIVKTNGSYTVSIDSGSAVSDSIVVTVNVLPPIPTISVNADTLTSSSANGNQWYLDGNIISAAILQQYLAIQNGDYTVKSTNSNYCSSVSIPYNYSVIGVSIQGVILDNSCAIIPNPNNGIFRIETKDLSISKIKIYTIIGEIIYESKKPNEEIDLSTEPKGTYFIEIDSENNTSYNKLLIQ